MLRCLVSSEDRMGAWRKSPAYGAIVSFLRELSISVKSSARDQSTCHNPIVASIVDSLKRVLSIINNVEPAPNSSPFSNPSYKEALRQISLNSHDILKDVTTNSECIEYFSRSFGSHGLVEFGTGHELNFLAFLTSLSSLRLISSSDYSAIVFDVLWLYWDSIILIKDKYNPAPAGSQGSWGIDDYVLLPFVLGSSQLIGNNELTPASVVDPSVSADYSDKFVYCKWVCYLERSKRGPFEEKCRILYSLRQIPSFLELHDRMFKQFETNVLGRFVIINHFPFGSILSLN